MKYSQYYTLVDKLLNLTDKHKPMPTRQKDSKGTYTVTGATLSFKDLGNIEPIMTKRFIDPKKAIGELDWMLEGSNSFDILKIYNIKWWDSYKPLGPIYGAQLLYRDQLEKFCEAIEEDRYSRRHILNLWNVDQLDQMAIPPCYYSLQLVITKTFRTKRGPVSKDATRGDDGTLIVTQRSADVFLGLPYDILVWQFFILILAAFYNFRPYKLVFNIASAHLYHEHIEAASKMASNFIRPSHLFSLRADIPMQYHDKPYEYLRFRRGKEEDFHIRPYYNMGIPKITGKLFK